MTEAAYRYAAVDATGKRRYGVLPALSESEAFDTLVRTGLSPLRIKATRKKAGERIIALSERELAQVLSDLASLLGAGADIVRALAVLSEQAERRAVAIFCKALSSEVSGGSTVERSLQGYLRPRQLFVAALVASGEASGDLQGALRRAGDVLTSRLKLRQQLLSSLSYPAFVLMSTLGALSAIMLFVIPSLSTMIDDQTPRYAPIRLLVSASTTFQASLPALGTIALAFGGLGFVAFRAGLLVRPADVLIHSGPWGRTTRSITYGAFCVSLGTMLRARAPLADAMRLSLRSVRSKSAIERLTKAAEDVRDGRPLSHALAAVAQFPPSLSRLVAVGEMTGELGQALERGGKFEEEQALERIKRWGEIAGPLLIASVGIVIGGLMATLLGSLNSVGSGS